MPRKPNEQRVQKFASQVFEDAATFMHGILTYLGDRLGIFSAMAKADYLTVKDLSDRTNLDERYLREWLGAMAAAGYVDYDSATGKYFLPKEHAQVLADEDSPYFLAGMFQEAFCGAAVAPLVMNKFRMGGGIRSTEYPADAAEGTARCSKPVFKHLLAQTWIPQISGVSESLLAGGSALDVGCGYGFAAMAIASAFPRARVFGFDSNPTCIVQANANSKAAGLSDQITFQVHDCNNLPKRKFEFIFTGDVVHDVACPLDLMKSIRSALTADGAYLMAERAASANVEENTGPIGKLLYSASTLYCVPVSLAENGEAVGLLMGESKARELAEQAGFSIFRQLQSRERTTALYELRP